MLRRSKVLKPFCSGRHHFTRKEKDGPVKSSKCFQDIVGLPDKCCVSKQTSNVWPSGRTDVRPRGAHRNNVIVTPTKP